MSQHIPLVTASPGWLEKPAFWTKHLDPISAACPKCDERQRIYQDFTALFEMYSSTVKNLQNHQRVMLELQAQVRRWSEETSRIYKALTDPASTHARCQLCYQPVGPGHAATDLVREPHGTALVCIGCHDRLKRRKTVVTPTNATG